MADLAWSSDLQLAIAGDRDAFMRLLREMKSDMYGLARTLLNKDEDCADVMQETVYKAYRNIKTLREPAYFRTWVFRILIRECQLVYRRRDRSILSERMPDIGGVIPKPRDLDLVAAVDRLNERLHSRVSDHFA